MALKDHKQELWCASAIAGLIRHQALQKLEGQRLLIGALRGVVAQREQKVYDAQVEEVAGFTFGSW
jgi:hypothetical protein